MTSPAYSITARQIIVAPSGQLILDFQDPQFVNVIEDIHVSVGVPGGASRAFVDVLQGGGVTQEFIFFAALGVSETGTLPPAYAQQTGQWVVTAEDQVVCTLLDGPNTGIFTLGLRAYRAGRVIAGFADTRDIVVNLGGPVPAGQRWLLRDLTVAQRDPTDPGPCPWTAGSAALGSTGQLAGAIISTVELPDLPNIQHLTPRVVLDEGETLLGQKPFGGDQHLSWRATFFVLEPPLHPEPGP